MKRGARWRSVTALVVMVVLAPACADDGESATPDPTTTSRPTTTSTSAAANTGEQPVLEAYQGYWRAILAANNPPDQSHPDLKKYATGEAYKSVFDAAQANRLDGRGLRLPENSKTEHRADVIALEAERATIRDCAIDDGVVFKIATGEVVNDAVTTRLVTATMVREDGLWKVSHTKIEQTWRGVAGCAVG